jgi:hypothetical protein
LPARLQRFRLRHGSAFRQLPWHCWCGMCGDRGLWVLYDSVGFVFA